MSYTDISTKALPRNYGKQCGISGKIEMGLYTQKKAGWIRRKFYRKWKKSIAEVLLSYLH